MKPHYITETLNPELQTQYQYMFFKFGTEEHMNNFREKGQIFCSSLENLRQGEEDHRNDSFEGASEVEAWEAGVLTIKDPVTGEVMDLKVSQTVYMSTYEKIGGNICSFYCMTDLNYAGKSSFSIDPRLKGFGTHALIINNLPEFKKRVRAHLAKLNIPCAMSLVEYYDPHNYKGKISAFQKRKEYSYQHEFRLFLNRDAFDNCIIEIGSLEDICQVVTAEWLLTKLFYKKPRFIN